MPIIKGESENSYMIQLMESDDPHEVMPRHPSRDPAYGKVMSKEDIELVKEWIRQGAVYEPHLGIRAAGIMQTSARWVGTPVIRSS